MSAARAPSPPVNLPDLPDLDVAMRAAAARGVSASAAGRALGLSPGSVWRWCVRNPDVLWGPRRAIALRTLATAGLTVPQAARRLNVSEQSIYAYCRVHADIRFAEAPRGAARRMAVPPPVEVPARALFALTTAQRRDYQTLTGIGAYPAAEAYAMVTAPRPTIRRAAQVQGQGVRL